MAATLETAPWLMAVGRYKAFIFPAVGALLLFNYWLAIVRPRRLNCAPGEICHIDSPSSRFNRTLFWSSVVIYVGAVGLTYGADWWIRQS